MKYFNFAFPGLGKTTLCRRIGGHVDMDYAFYRYAFNTSLKDEKFLSQLSELAHIYAENGYRVWLNEPKMMPEFSYSKSVVCYVPGNTKMTKRCAQKLNVDVATVVDWVNGWIAQANKYNIPVVMLDTGLSDYFNLSKLSKRKEVKHAL